VWKSDHWSKEPHFSNMSSLQYPRIQLFHTSPCFWNFTFIFRCTLSWILIIPLLSLTQTVTLKHVCALEFNKAHYRDLLVSKKEDKTQPNNKFQITCTPLILYVSYKCLGMHFFRWHRNSAGWKCWSRLHW